MQRDELMENNKVYIAGITVGEPVFSHEVYGEAFYSVKMEVARLSDAVDVLPITVSERLARPGEMLVGTHMQLWGQIRSYNSYVESERRNRLMLTLFARDIVIAANSDEAGHKNPNEIFLNGYICKPPTHRMTPFGREITDMLLAVNRSYNKSDYIPCIAWGRNSRYASRMSVGDRIKLLGRMQSREYQKKLSEDTVETRVAYEVSISKIETSET